MPDLLAALTWAAAHTTRLRLGTGVLLLPQRNPIVVAKEWATFDHLSGGRLELGVGVGSIEQEYRALGIDYTRRGVLLDEHLDALEALWYSDKPRYLGSTVAVEAVDARPRPVQRPVPVVFGGHSRPAYRRSVARGAGWYGFRLGPDATAEALAELRRAADEVERRSDLGNLEISISPEGQVNAELVDAYRKLGVDRLVTFAGRGDDGVERSIERTLAAFGED
jgi:probable F420-dependent oxidoreductase